MGKVHKFEHKYEQAVQHTSNLSFQILLIFVLWKQINNYVHNGMVVAITHKDKGKQKETYKILISLNWRAN